jgi:DNA-binding transcriptional MerR regulator
MLQSTMARSKPSQTPLPGADGARRLTVDELARAAGPTTRQVRALQTQGLLPHPHLVGRTGYYDDDHLDRLRAVLRLQADGFSLASLASLLRAWEANLTLGAVLGLHAPVHRVTEDDADVFGALDRRVGGRSTRTTLLSLVPSTILDEAAAS